MSLLLQHLEKPLPRFRQVASKGKSAGAGPGGAARDGKGECSAPSEVIVEREITIGVVVERESQRGRYQKFGS